jgi:hypothetical protein
MSLSRPFKDLADLQTHPCPSLGPSKIFQIFRLIHVVFKAYDLESLLLRHDMVIVT